MTINDRTFTSSMWIDSEGSVDQLISHLHEAQQTNAKSLLILACDSDQYTPDSLDQYLKQIDIPVFGGIFPEIIANQHVLKQGSIVFALPIAVNVMHIEKLSDPEQDYYIQVQDIANNIPQGASLITLVDGLSARISALIESLYEVIGSESKYIGGGAGSLSFKQKPCLFSNDGLLEDCAQITAIQKPINIGINHGWHTFAGPFFVTGAHDNTIETLDYKPAFDVYRDVVEQDSGLSFDEHDFFELAKAYPFGLDRLTGDVVVRDPLYRKDNDLVCVGEVPPNHMIHILKGNADNLLNASEICAKTAINEEEVYDFALLFDCISRTLFLQEQFQEEIGNIQKHLPSDVPLIGALSLGEIADGGNACLEFFNKTIVLGAFHAESKTS